ncbi:MAG: helix-turn-helix domain-containing protein [Paracoccus sp. (in: a-proteobacteria)]|nr:helix-turn-helix domain-containing protein [Paracoccus sp. (in: a-proteobacteria)]
MSNRSDIHARLATALKEARKARGLSLEAVSRLSGVSRSMVSQIERGESSPTVATLWNLTRALQVDFAGLLEPRDSARIDVTRAGAAPVIGGHVQGVTIRILSPPETAGEHEVYDLSFRQGTQLQSEPHSPGCHEHLTVLEGLLDVTSGKEVERLGPGDTARYAADRPHSIAAPDGPARAILIVQNS